MGPVVPLRAAGFPRACRLRTAQAARGRAGTRVPQPPGVACPAHGRKFPPPRPSSRYEIAPLCSRSIQGRKFLLTSFFLPDEHPYHHPNVWLSRMENFLLMANKSSTI